MSKSQEEWDYEIEAERFVEIRDLLQRIAEALERAFPAPAEVSAPPPPMEDRP